MALCLKVCSMSTLTNVHKWSVKVSFTANFNKLVSKSFYYLHILSIVKAYNWI